jgi:RNA polymerase sigma-54 factor
MGMEMKLQFKLAQQLVMTPQLVQAIRLLQLSRMELVDEVRKELDANPVLADDIIDPRATASPKDGIQSRVGDAPLEERIGVTERVEPNTDLAAREVDKKVAEVDWEQFLENRQLQTPTTATRSGFDELPPIEQSLTKATSLRDHLMWQLQMSDMVENERNFATLVIGNIDERGYLDLEGGEDGHGNKVPDLTIDDLAREAGLDPEDAEDVLALIQRFDPVGVAARDLRECLLVQAEVLRLRRHRDHDHQRPPPQPGEAQLPGDRARAEGRARGGLRGRQGDPEARERPGAELHRHRRQADRDHAGRLRDQGRRQVQRQLDNDAACSGSTSTSSSPSAC